MRRFAFAIVTALAVGPAAFAQAPAAYSPTAEDTKWVQSRVNFLAMMYDLAPDQRTALDQMATRLIPDQAAYQNDPTVRQSTRSLMTAMESTLSDQAGATPPVSENLRGTVVERLNGQLYAIYAKAPLSYANLTAKLNPTLPKEKVDAAQAKMKANFADRLRKSGAELSPATIDMLAGQAVELPSLAMKKIDLRLPPSAPPAPPAAPAQPLPPQAKANPVPPPTPPTPAAPIPPGPPPQNPPRNYGPAPAVDSWASHVDGLTQKYEFKPDQIAKAKAILEQAIKRGNYVKETNTDALAKANAMPDGADKTKHLAEVNKSTDEVFGVMHDRIVSLASIEQRVKADGDAAFKPAPLPTPAAPAVKPPMPVTPTAVKPAAAAPGAAPAAVAPAKPVEPAKPADGHSHDGHSHDDGHKH